MAVPRFGKAQSPEEILILITTAIALKKPVAAVYENRPRSLCPHILGWNKDRDLRVLCYQYAGASSTGLGPKGSPANWRCLAVAKLSAIQLLSEPWQSGEQHSRTQSCIEHVLLDAEKLPI